MSQLLPTSHPIFLKIFDVHVCYYVYIQVIHRNIAFGCWYVRKCPFHSRSVYNTSFSDKSDRVGEVVLEHYNCGDKPLN